MGFEIPLWFEIGAFVVLLTILIADLLLIIKRPHIPSTKESTLWVVFYVALAIAFAGILFGVTGNADVTGQFVAGWLTEYSLSIDNLFVFVIIMARFSVPKRLQPEVLMVGIIIALIFRGIFILLGAQLIESFSWVFYLFGAFLLFTAWKQAFGHNEDAEDGETALITYMKRHISVSPDFHDSKLRTVIDGKKVWTPMLIVFIAIGTTDVMFALDSIPAIFGITQSPFIVFTANIFALMGLRQLYFLLGGLLDRLKYLHYGIAFILAFIGVKLIFHAMHENELPFINGGEHIEWVPDISTWMSLGVIVASMVVATVASLIASSRERKAPTPQAAAAAVAEEHATPPTVEEPGSTDRRTER